MHIVACDAWCQVVERANNVKYGLCASVWTSDINTAHRVARKLEVRIYAKNTDAQALLVRSVVDLLYLYHSGRGYLA